MAGTDFVHQVKFFNKTNEKIITCKDYSIRIWKIYYKAKNLLFRR